MAQGIAYPLLLHNLAEGDGHKEQGSGERRDDEQDEQEHTQERHTDSSFLLFVRIVIASD
jgi:hypothetical protein